MTQVIDPIKLKAAAEYLEWVCQQYPDVLEVQDLYSSMSALIDDSKKGMILSVIDKNKVPCAYNFIDGLYIQYNDPSVDKAYVSFSIELRGGLTEQEKRIKAKFAAMVSDTQGAKHE